MNETIAEGAWSLESKRHRLQLRTQRTWESYTLRALSYKLRHKDAKQLSCLNKALAKDPSVRMLPHCFLSNTTFAIRRMWISILMIQAIFKQRAQPFQAEGYQLVKILYKGNVNSFFN